ncbi:MAG: BamA/TamA family outer membrane protein [Pirellulales bacterium]
MLCWLMVLTAVGMSSGCHKMGAHRPADLLSASIPTSRQAPFMSGSTTLAAATPVNRSTIPGYPSLTERPVVRGQNEQGNRFGGSSVSQMPDEPLGDTVMGPRYSTPNPPFAGQQVQYAQPAQAFPPGAGTAPNFQGPFYPPGTGLDQNFGGQPTLPNGGYVFPTNQPPFTPQSPLVLPEKPIDLDLVLQEAQTGRFMFGLGINSDAGLVGNVVIDEQNFDILRLPTGIDDWLNGTAFRGAGQRFRAEALPGTEVQRYSVSLSDPYFLGTSVSFGVSGFYYERQFTDWDERRWGGRVNLGYLFPERPDLSTTLSARYEEIEIAKPSAPAPELLAVVGSNQLISLRWEVAHDTRDNAFLPSEGHLLRLAYEQGLGTFTYPRFEGDFRRYFVMRERPDGSGRHVLGIAGRLGVSGSDTPIYENFFAGGFSTLRGFEFRGASPRTLGVVVGGEFQLLTSAEYRFPLTADDNLYGSFFVDGGTVERSVEINNFRVTPGFELRINIPALGPVPLAVGFGVPISHAPGDQLQVFHFFVGVSR